MFFYVPAVFVLGHDVRELTWEGGVNGLVKGDVARKVLLRSLALQVHLLDDWECRAEYTRTLSVALLQWQPWMSALPGCCFAEESCEALLSRMVGRCRANTNLMDFSDILNLYVTLPTPAREPKGNVGAIRQPLVVLFLRRLQRIMTHPDSQPHAELLSAREARWHATAPADFKMPVTPATNATRRSMEFVLQGALVSLTAPAPVSAEVRAFCDENMPLVTDDQQVAIRSGSHAKVKQWAAQCRQRQRVHRDADRQQNTPVVVSGSQELCFLPPMQYCITPC